MVSLDRSIEDPAAILAELDRELNPQRIKAILMRLFHATVQIAERDGKEPYLPPDFLKSLRNLTMDTRLAMFAEITAERREISAPLQWAERFLEASIEEDCKERRAARGANDHAPVTIPHPSLVVEHKLDVEYTFDPDQIYEGLRPTPEEAEQQLIIEPEREEYVLPLDKGQVAAIQLAISVFRNPLRDDSNNVYGPAAVMLESLLAKRKIPGSMKVRNTTSLLAWLKRNVGSPEAAVVAQGVTKRVVNSKMTIKPKKLPRRVEPILRPPAIEVVAEGVA